MDTSDFFDRLDDDRVLAAIREAEAGTSGEIRVFVSRNPAPDALAVARAQFARLGMERTPMRNAVLLFLAPKSRTCAILGDEAIHLRAGQRFWDATEEALEQQLRSGDVTPAITGAVARIGAELARHFPKNDGDRNDLPDQVLRD